MEINTIKINKEEVYIIFTGMQYYFFSNNYGLIGIARRLGYEENVVHTFELAASDNTLGRHARRTIISKMNDYVSKMENRYMKHDTIFIDNNATLNHGLVINDVEYK